MEVPTELTPADAIERLLARIEAVGSEQVGDWSPRALLGRVLAEPVRLDRDSPACDVSAMDGFAVRLAEFEAAPLPILGECRIGEAPEELQPGMAMRIYTGSPTPRGGDTVVPLERVEEVGGEATFARRDGITTGANIRRQAENARGGSAVLAAGEVLTPASMTALATISPPSLSVYRRLSIAIIVTGDELDRDRSQSLPPWRLRDSNGPTLEALVGGQPWAGRVESIGSKDNLDDLAATIRGALETADAVILTGGVSKGAYDFVPDAVTAAGGTPLLHRLSARPGRPTFAAIADGRPVIGLPGNPVAVLTAGVRLLAPALRKRAGVASLPQPTLVRLQEWTGKSLPLTWWRPVKLESDGVARLVPLRGSGDTCGPAASDGFIECPPGTSEAGNFPFFPWSL